ncbi:MAG: hypothetical protein ABIH74_05155 [Candidatus Omnitrophota bacterium]
MILYLIGMDYKTAALSAREKAYRERREIESFCGESRKESAALFTCNRAEIYGLAESIGHAAEKIKQFQHAFPGFLDNTHVKYGNDEVIHHALRLAGGLESQIVGETQILEQLESWIEKEAFPPVLKKVWKTVLIRARGIRLKSRLSEGACDIAEIIAADIASKTDPNRPKEIVIIGTGKVARLFAENKMPGTDMIFVSRKKRSRAKQLAERSEGRVVLLDDLSGALLTADALVSATASPHYMLRKKTLIDIMKKRDRTLHLYDLSVPRDIEPEANGVAGVFLRNLDDLAPFAEKRNRRLSRQILEADSMIREMAESVIEEVETYATQSRNAPQPAGVAAG